jgi:uncharacterized protein (DUF4415 family)
MEGAMSDYVSDTGRRHSWTDEEIERIANADTEFPRISEDDLARALAVSASGRIKVPISIRIDEAALEAVRAEGPRYQTRINDLVVAYSRGTLCSLDEDVVHAFRASRGDWRARINEVLREHVREPRISHKDVGAQRARA